MTLSHTMTMMAIATYRGPHHQLPVGVVRGVGVVEVVEQI